MMPDMRIDRLRLDVSGLAALDGERLAVLVAKGLAAADPIAGPRRIEKIEANVAAGEQTATAELSAKIVAEILRQVSRTA